MKSLRLNGTIDIPFDLEICVACALLVACSVCKSQSSCYSKRHEDLTKSNSVRKQKEPHHEVKKLPNINDIFRDAHNKLGIKLQ